jgi:hypothetical protein
MLGYSPLKQKTQFNLQRQSTLSKGHHESLALKPPPSVHNQIIFVRICSTKASRMNLSTEETIFTFHMLCCLHKGTFEQ